MHFEQTLDMGLVRSVLTHPRIYPAITDDGCPGVETFEPNPSMLYVTVRDKGELLGIFALEGRNAICYEIHTCLLPRAWGERAKQAARGMREWLFANTPCQRIITTIPLYNTLAVRFAVEAGMEEFGINPDSYLKGGKLYGQILMGVSKCQQQ